MNQDAVVVKRVRVRVLEYNEARCEVCNKVVKGLSCGPLFKYRCRCGNKWEGKPVQLVALVASNGQAKAAVTCPECGHHFPLTVNGANGNGNGKPH